MEKWKKEKKEGKKKMNTVEDLHIFILNKKIKKDRTGQKRTKNENKKKKYRYLCDNDFVGRQGNFIVIIFLEHHHRGINRNI